MDRFRKLVLALLIGLLVLPAARRSYAAVPANWTVRDSGTSVDLWRIAYGGGRFVAVGDTGQVVVSARGDVWIPRAVPDPCDVTDVAYGNGTFVAVCGKGFAKIFTSPDGMSWQQVQLSVIPGVSSVSFLDGRFLASGSDVYSSTNGILWTKVATGSEVFQSTGLSFSTHGGLDFGNGAFVTTGLLRGMNDASLFSNDTVNWTGISLSRRYELQDIAFGNGVFRAVGKNGSGFVIQSQNGSSWTEIGSAGGPLYGIGFGNGEFVWGGNAIYTDAGSIAAANRVHDIVFARGTYVAVGSGGLIMQSDPVAGGLAVPAGQEFYGYQAGPSPFLAPAPAQTLPVAAGAFASGGSNIDIHVTTGGYASPVDIYFGVYAPDLDPQTIFILNSDYQFRTLADGLVPWKASSMGDVDEVLFGSIPAAALPSGTYHLYLMVTPARLSDLSAFVLWDAVVTVP